MDIKFDMDVNLEDWASAIGYQIIGDKVIPKKVFSLSDFEQCVRGYISESLNNGTNSGAVTEIFMANDDEQDILKDMLEECEKQNDLSVGKKEKYIVVEIIEREFTFAGVCNDWDSAFDMMFERFKEKAGEEFSEDFPENIKEYVSTCEYSEDQFGISDNSAWLNAKDNHDWKIIKVEIVGNEIIIKN